MVSFKEGPHAAAAILSEANGQLSRDNINIPIGQKFPPGTLIVVSTGVPYAGGAGPLAYAIYGVDTTVAGATAVKIACIVRDAELNRHAIAWPAGFTDAQKDTAATTLATQFVIVRGAALPSPALTGFAEEAPPLPSPPPE